MKRGALYCRRVSFRGLPEFIRSLGGSPEQIFEAVGLDISAIEQGDGFYAWDKVCDLLELAARKLDEPSFGIMWAHEIPTDFLNSGPMLLIGALVPTLREFIDLSVPYQKLHTNGVSYRYQENLDAQQIQFSFDFHPASPPCRQYVEHIAANIILMERHHIGKMRLKKFQFQHAAPRDTSWHTKTFQCPIEFNANTNGGFTDLGFLDVKLGGKLKRLQPILRMYLDKRLKTHARFEVSISQTVEQVLPTILGAGLSDMGTVAQILELNPKKLQRLLRDEGVTFSEILNDARHMMTKWLLLESDISISHLAQLLDYGSSEAFNAACKRWFGEPPLKYRQILREA